MFSITINGNRATGLVRSILEDLADEIIAEYRYQGGVEELNDIDTTDLYRTYDATILRYAEWLYRTTLNLPQTYRLNDEQKTHAMGLLMAYICADAEEDYHLCDVINRPRTYTIPSIIEYSDFNYWEGRFEYVSARGVIDEDIAPKVRVIEKWNQPSEAYRYYAIMKGEGFTITELFGDNYDKQPRIKFYIH